MNFPPYNIYYIYVFDLSPWLISLGLNCLYNLMSLTHHSHCITYDLFQTFILYLSFIPLLLRNITIRATLFRSYIWCGYYVCCHVRHVCVSYREEECQVWKVKLFGFVAGYTCVLSQTVCRSESSSGVTCCLDFHDMSTRGKVRPKEGLQEEEESIIQDI